MLVTDTTAGMKSFPESSADVVLEAVFRQQRQLVLEDVDSDCLHHLVQVVRSGALQCLRTLSVSRSGVEGEAEAMELAGFESAGNVMSRVSTFEQPAPADEATQPAERELDGFESAGNVKERVSTFGQAEAISDGSEEEKQEEEENGEDEKEREAEQERVSKLPRDELKIYPYDVLTVRAESENDH